MATYAEQLASVQAAIADIEANGQAVGFENRSWQAADLKALYDREAWLRRMVAREARGGMRVRLGVPFSS